jgi:hypothetical protein
MKHIKIASLIACLAISTFGFAKQVVFSVDMTGQTISPNGVHISGDFQDEAGYPADWESGTTQMLRQGTSDIYSVTVNIPAFRKYEFKFVNGIMFYEVEFVPEKSRVGFDFNDNRWIYVDSLSEGVTVLPTLMFGGNAPAGQKMIRFKVDMSQTSSIDSKGMHVGGTFAAWDYTFFYMWSFSDKVYECMAYTSGGNVEYKFMNGRDGSKYETVSGACANANNNRSINVSSDTVLNEVCFGSCTDCIASILPQNTLESGFTLSPNPSNHGNVMLHLNTPNTGYSIIIRDIIGREVLVKTDIISPDFEINTGMLQKGIYTVGVSGLETQFSTLKLLVD